MRNNTHMAHRSLPILYLFATLACIMLFLAPTTKAFSDAVVMVEPNSVSTQVGETFSLNVTVVEVQNLYGLEAILTWNSTILMLTEVEVQLGQVGGALNSPVYLAANSTQGNRYTISAASTTPAPPFNGSGNVVRMNFSVVSMGACNIDLQTQLYDYPPSDRDPPLSLPITHTDVDGFFQTIIPEFPSNLVLAATAILTLSIAALFKCMVRSHEKTFDELLSTDEQHSRTGTTSSSWCVE